jgi:HAE1 family hydrophobic/amphiphilic exporter-1
MEVTEKEVIKVENLVRSIVTPGDLRLVVSNIGSTPDLSSIYTSNSAPHTAYVQVSLADGHKVGSYAYMDRVREALRRQTRRS